MILTTTDSINGKELETGVLEYLRTSRVITRETLIIIEASLETDFSYLGEGGFRLIREKIYKTNKHIFVKRESE